MNKVLQFQLTVQDIFPTIWRQFEVTDNFSFLDLHFLIQILMRWSNEHLFEFETQKKIIVHKSNNLFANNSIEFSADETLLKSIIKRKGQEINYTYDFGDHWRITLKVDSRTDDEGLFLYPRLLDGERSGPLEDSGGASMYMELVKAFQDNSHPNHIKMLNEWDKLGFDPELMDVNIIRNDFESYGRNVLQQEKELDLLFSMLEGEYEYEFDGNPPLAQDQLEVSQLLESEESTMIVPREYQLTIKDFYTLISTPFAENSPIKINTDLPLFSLHQSPYFKLTHLFLNLVHEEGKIKATKKGNLPLKLVKALDDSGIMSLEHKESVIGKPRTETEHEEIHTLRLVCRMAGLLKLQKGIFSLTKKGEKLSIEKNATTLFKEIFHTYCEKFNWSYWDGFMDEHFGQFGLGVLVLLFKKYGSEERESSFYLEKYLEIFPQFQLGIVDQEMMDSYGYPLMERMLNIRVFERAFYKWGLINLRKEGEREERKIYVKSTPLLNQLFISSLQENKRR